MPQVSINIANRTYELACGEGEEKRVHELAAYVDGQMKEVARSTNTVDSLRVAVLAALNVADELFRARQTRDSVDGALEDRARHLAQELSGALGE